MNDLKDDARQEIDSTTDEATSGFYGDKEQVLARYSRCGFCGAHLHFTHLSDFSRNLTQEIAKCPECGTQARKITHRLQ